jgi:hypothetical protein
VIVSLMLICAVGASLALGVLMAYGICQAMFRIFRVHSLSAARQRVTTTAPVRASIEG